MKAPGSARVLNFVNRSERRRGRQRPKARRVGRIDAVPVPPYRISFIATALPGPPTDRLRRLGAVGDGRLFRGGL
jgi:hypothetical protein